MSNNYTIGVEEEYMLCDNAGDLINKADYLMDNIPVDIKERFSYELILSEFESNTSINDNLFECMNEISFLRNTIKNLAVNNNFRIGPGTASKLGLRDFYLEKLQTDSWILG